MATRWRVTAMTTWRPGVLLAGFLVMALGAASRIDAQVPTGRLDADWLLSGAGFEARVTTSADGRSLSIGNGLVRRVFRLRPNGGCNSSPNVFSPIECGQTYLGSGAYDGSLRDTDWYEVVVTEPTIFTWTATAQFPFVIGLAETVPPGTGNCVDHPGSLNPFAFGAAGDTVSVTTTCLPPGTYWFFMAPDFSVTVPCPTPYEATLTCDAPCVAMGLPPAGDGPATARTGARPAD